MKKTSRTSDTLRIYQAGNYIDYNVTAVPNSGLPQYGTLRITWENTTQAIFDPIDGSQIFPDLKATTTLTYDGSTDADVVVVQYISQVNTDPADPNQGSIILHAIDDEIGAHYWPYAPASVGAPSSPVYTPVIFNSPMTFGTPLNSPQAFSVMQCDANANQCPSNGEIYKYNNSFDVVGDSREISTELGIFSNPFEVNFSGSTQPQNAPALSFVGNIFDLCGDSTENISHNGKMFVMPQLGVIQMNNTCTNNSTGETVQYNISARSTNIRF